jgi:hypothetical protein
MAYSLLIQLLNGDKLKCSSAVVERRKSFALEYGHNIVIRVVGMILVT